MSHAGRRAAAQLLGGGVVQPDDISGLTVWLDTESLGLGNGVGIDPWNDLAGAEDPFVFSSTAPTNVSAGLDGKAYANFNGTTAYLVYSGFVSPMSGKTAGTMMVVVRRDSDATDAGVVTSWGAGDTACFYPFSGTIYDQWGSTVRKTTVNPSTSLASWNIYVVQSASGLWRNYLNGGSPLYTTATNTVSFASDGYIGKSNSAIFKGDVATLVAYDSQLSAADVNDLAAYMVDRYPSLTWSDIS